VIVLDFHTNDHLELARRRRARKKNNRTKTERLTGTPTGRRNNTDEETRIRKKNIECMNRKTYQKKISLDY
jgi:hypothetical protein